MIPLDVKHFCVYRDRFRGAANSSDLPRTRHIWTHLSSTQISSRVEQLVNLLQILDSQRRPSPSRLRRIRWQEETIKAKRLSSGSCVWAPTRCFPEHRLHMLALFRLKGTNAKTCTFFSLLLGDQRLLSGETEEHIQSVWFSCFLCSCSRLIPEIDRLGFESDTPAVPHYPAGTSAGGRAAWHRPAGPVRSKDWTSIFFISYLSRKPSKTNLIERKQSQYIINVLN